MRKLSHFVVCCMLCAVCCMLFSGCGKKESNELSNVDDVSKETEYLKNYIDKFNIQISKMGSSKVLEIFVDATSKNIDTSRILKMSYQDWFKDYDYIFLICYGYNTVTALLQYDVKSGEAISTLYIEEPEKNE